MITSEDTNLTPLKMLQVNLTPMPGESNSWRAHFQYGQRGFKKEGAYISRSTMISMSDATNILAEYNKHTRSLNPGSTTMYFTFDKPGCMQNDDIIIGDSIDRQTLVSYIKGDIDNLWPGEKDFVSKVEKELESASKEVQAEVVKLAGDNNSMPTLNELLGIKSDKKDETFH